jgi:hypothetical protein
MEDGEDFRHAPSEYPSCFPSSLEHAAGSDNDAAMLDAADWMLWEDINGGFCLYQNDLTDIQPIPSANGGLAMIRYDGLATPELPGFPNGPEENVSKGSVADLRSSPTFLPAQYLVGPDTSTMEQVYPPNQMGSSSNATSHIHEQILTFPIRSRYPCSEDWESYRPIITRLYIKEDKTLKEVKSIMKDVYGFVAS